VAAELRNALDAEVKLVPGAGGVFDVTVDGRLVFSKDKTGRFPDEGEITELVRASQ